MKNIIDTMIRSLPRYKIKQPSTNENVIFRPFVVREEKSLYMVNETGNYEDFLATPPITSKQFALHAVNPSNQEYPKSVRVISNPLHEFCELLESK